MQNQFRTSVAFSIVMASTFLLASTGEAQEVIHLWADGAPGFEDRRDEPEEAQDWWVKNVHSPSITAFLPEPNKATGAAVLVIPGGGHRELVFDAEGTEAAVFLNDIGVAVFVLKYRLAREDGSPYKLPEHARQDAERAMRLIRSRAIEWQLDSGKVGVMGFSAGGEVAAFIAYQEGLGDKNSISLVEREKSQPDFQILIYPGPLGIPEAVPAHAPPAFMLAAIDDPCCVKPVLDLVDLYLEQGIPAELHVYARGGHGFNLGQRATANSLASWTDRLVDWLIESEIAVPDLALESNLTKENL